MGKYLVHRPAPMARPQALPPIPASLVTPPEGSEVQLPLFKTNVPRTEVRVTRIGFFGKVHGQTGMSPQNGIELHPILKIEFV